MGVQTSNISTDSGDLSIDPNGGQTLIKSVTANNPGVTPVAAASDGTVKKLVVTELATKNALEDDDWVLVHDTATGNTVRVPGSEFGKAGQPPFKDPLPEIDGNWISATTALAVRAGGNGSTAALKNSVEFAVNNQTFNQSQKNVNQGDKVYVRWMDSKIQQASHGQTISGELYSTDNKFSQIWNLTIAKQPVGWDIPPKIDQPLSTEITSDITIPTGMNVPSPVTVVTGTLTNITFSINGGAYGTTGNILSGQTLQIRGTTGAANSTAYTAEISIGGLSRTWSVTTEDLVVSTAKAPNVIYPNHQGTLETGNNISYQSTGLGGVKPPGNDTFLSSDWRIAWGGAAPGSNILLYESVPATSGKPGRPQVVAPAAAAGEKIYASVRYNWQTAGTTAWSHEEYGYYHYVSIEAPVGSPPPPPSWDTGCGACGTEWTDESANWDELSSSTCTINTPQPVPPGNPVSITYTGGWRGNPLTGGNPRKHPIGGAHVYEDGTRRFVGEAGGCGPLWPTKSCDEATNYGVGQCNGKYGYQPKEQNVSCRSIGHGRVQWSFAPCPTSFSAVGGVTGDTNGTAAPGDLLKFINLEIDGRPAWTTEYHYSIISYKYVPDDGSLGTCGGTEVTLNKEFEKGLKAIKWPANANEIDSNALQTSKVTEIKFGARIVWSSDVDEVTTIYATGCP